jgi:hypothetical protein
MEEVGLTLKEDRALVQSFDLRMIADQILAYTRCCRECPDCGSLQHYKDVRTKCVQTIHGSYRFRDMPGVTRLPSNVLPTGRVGS